MASLIFTVFGFNQRKLESCQYLKTKTQSLSHADLLSVFQVQGMSFIAAVLILNLEEAEAFITFANLLNKPCQMAFFRVDHELVHKDTITVTQSFYSGKQSFIPSLLSLSLSIFTLSLCLSGRC